MYRWLFEMRIAQIISKNLVLNLFKIRIVNVSSIKPHPLGQILTSNRFKSTATAESARNIFLIKPNKLAEPWLPLATRGSKNQNSYREILAECGVQNINENYSNFVPIMWNTVTALKKHDYIPSKLDVAMHIRQHIVDCELDLSKLTLDDSQCLGTIRFKIMCAYVNQLIECPLDRMQPALLEYPRLILHHSFADIHRTYNMLKYEFGFTPTELREHVKLFGVYEPNIRAMLASASNDKQVDMKAILSTLALQRNYQNVSKTIDILHKYEIPAHYVNKCLKIFTLAPKTVDKRLEHLTSLEKLKYLWQNERSLWLVVFYKRILKRLDASECVPLRKITLSMIMDNDDDAYTKYVPSMLLLCIY